LAWIWLHCNCRRTDRGTQPAWYHWLRNFLRCPRNWCNCTSARVRSALFASLRSRGCSHPCCTSTGCDQRPSAVSVHDRSMSAFETFLEGAVRTATPLGFAALGETVVERSGIINIGLEGAIIAGAFGGFIAAGTGSVWLGFAGAMVAGIAVALVFAFFAIRMRADQIITGTAISLLCLGLTATLYQQAYGATGAALTPRQWAQLPCHFFHPFRFLVRPCSRSQRLPTHCT